MNKVFAIPFHVTRAENSIMPGNMHEAYVICYSSASDYVDAAKKSISALQLDGLITNEPMQPILELQIQDWEIHIAEQWPQYYPSLPNQSEFEEKMTKGVVVYGPFFGRTDISIS